MKCIDIRNEYCGFMDESVCCFNGCERDCNYHYRCEKIECEFHEDN